MKSLISSVARHPVLSNLLMLLLLFGGFYGFSSMRKELSPQIRIDMVQILVPFPGASAQEAEEGIITKIESALQGCYGVDKIDSTALEGSALLTITLEDGLSETVKQQTVIEIRSRVEQISDFPEQAMRPRITEIVNYTEAFLLALHGNVPEKILRETAFDIKESLQSLNISRVDLSGTRNYEISVEVSRSMIQQWNITLAQIAQAIQQASINLPGGMIRTNEEEYRIEIRGKYYKADEYKDIVVLSKEDGTIVRLNQIAKITETFEQDQSQGRFESEPAVLLSVFCVGNEDILEISEKVSRYLGYYNARIRFYEKTPLSIRQEAEKTLLAIYKNTLTSWEGEDILHVQIPLYSGKAFSSIQIRENGTSIALSEIAQVQEGFEIEKKLPYGIKLHIMMDLSLMVKDRMDMLFRNGLQGLTLVVLILWIFLNLRIAFWVALGIPVAFAFGGITMAAYGQSLNMISMFGLIIVLGIVVDDAIVISENVASHKAKGKKPMDASVDGASEMVWPVFSAVVTTIIAFVPLFFVQGIMGKFIAVLPLAVVSTLIGSLVESIWILPAHLGHEKEKPSEKQSIFIKVRQFIDSVLEYFILHVYSPLYRLSLKVRYITLSLSWVFFCFGIGLVASGLLPYVMFPVEDSLFLQASLTYPEGTSFSITQATIQKMEDAAKKINTEYSSYGKNGILVTGIYAEAGQGQGSQNKGNITLALVGPEFRTMHSEDILKNWAALVGKIPNAQMKFQSFGGGPKTSDIQLYLYEKDLENLRQATQEVLTSLESLDGVYEVESDLRIGKRELLIELTPQGKALGLTLWNLAEQLRFGFYGIEALKLQRGRDEVKVQVRYPASERSNMSDLYNSYIHTPSGESYLLSEVAKIKQQQGVSMIFRRNNKRRACIEARVDLAKTTSVKVVEDLKNNVLPALSKKYPEIQSSFSGADEENQKATGSLAFGFSFAMFGIFAVLSLIFKSYLQSLLILTTIPLGIVGALLGHWLLGYPLTLLSFFGIVALAGVVVNDAIVLIDTINESQRSGKSVKESLEKAGPARFRAILLTSLTTIAGLFPILNEKSFQAQSLKPMALALASGLFFSTMLTLFIIPCFYLVLNDLRRLYHRIMKGTLPTPEEVEPACREKNECVR